MEQSALNLNKAQSRRAGVGGWLSPQAQECGPLWRKVSGQQTGWRRKKDSDEMTGGAEAE